MAKTTGGLRESSVGLRPALVERFADGVWRPIWEAVAVVGHLIPPQMAVRVFCGNSDARRNVPLDDQIERGRREKVVAALRLLGAEFEVATASARHGGAPPAVAFRLAPGEYGQVRGERHGAAKLDVEKVRAIRGAKASGATNRALAREYDVSESTISLVVRGEKWRHVS